MPSLKDIKRRIRSVKNTAQITKAMEVVSATKMRRSQQIALGGRPYALAALDILKNISRRTVVQPAILLPRPVLRTLFLIVTSDKGLAGAFNANVLRLAERHMKDIRAGDYSVATVGKKGRDYYAARHIVSVKEFVGFGDFVDRKETEPLAEFLLAGYLQHAWDRVVVLYTNFRTTLKQEARAVEILPINVEKIEEAIGSITPKYGRYAEFTTHNSQPTTYEYEYKFEPSAEAVLEKLIPILFRIQIHHIILESNASEHSARMVAMKNASESAKDLIGELTIEYNKSRQAGITRELTEITGGTEALGG